MRHGAHVDANPLAANPSVESEPTHRTDLDHRPCWNLRGFTELCVQALFRHARPDWELIVVDNGSTNDTAAYLAGVRDAARVPVTIISNPQNVGFPRAINQGLPAAGGEYFVLLNNDAVVTDGWLDQLIALSAAAQEATNQEDPFWNTKGAKGTKGEEALRDVRGPESEALPTPRIGLVGPMSNYAAPPQWVENVP
jgi:glycosyltransferase involved in cell wall biosynthesis